MAKHNSGKTALVTGAARRLGRACALALAKRGFSIVAHYNSSEREARSLAKDVKKLGVACFLVQGDLSGPTEAACVFDRAVSLAGPLDVLVNNASIYEESDLATAGLEEITLNLNVHAFSPLVLSRRLAAQDRKSCIVNFLDARIVRATSPQAAYHVSKQLLFLLTRTMATEFAPRVRVNAIAPGAILPPAGKGQAYMRRLAAANPLHRTGSPDDICRALIYLVESDFVTGQVLFVDGGYHLK